ncbi:MAG TPA: O-antigen ligase family protein [Anaerolineae bacterium]|nr:O-antigen ligase family protein [Anaerolineae bacterium]
MIWLVGTLVLLPVDLISLPLNMNLVDFWILMGLPILVLSFTRAHHVISFPYTIAIWIILLASFASTFAAPAPQNSLAVIVKEVYVYIWFVTLTAILAKLNARDLRRILVVWSGMVFVHGFVIVAQFVSPDFWRLTARLAGSLKDFEIYRPSGLFVNANSAAIFQLLGFVPLVLASPSRKRAMILGTVLLLTMLATGSMGAAVAFTAGLAVAILAIFLSGHLALILKMFVRSAIAIALLGGLLYLVVSRNERFQEHIERILVGRADRSSEGRFDLWQRGLDAFLDQNTFLWGVGPENFREVDPAETDNQLHNDLLAFSVERGLLGALGLALFAVIAVSRAAYMVVIRNKYPARAQLTVVVFLAASIAASVESLTHQVFHFRELWLVLAFQEAMLYRMTISESGVKSTLRPRYATPNPRPGLVVQPHVIEDRLHLAD